MTYPDSVFNLPPSEAPVQRPKPIVGIVLLVLAVVGTGGLFLAPVRLVAMGVLIVLTAVVALVWFRVRERTTMVLTVATLGVLGIGLGIGIAVLLAGRFGADEATAPPPGVEPTSTQGDGGFVGPAAPSGVDQPPVPLPPPTGSAKPKPSVKPTATPKPTTTAKSDAAKPDPAKDKDAKDKASTEAEPKKERPKCSFGDVKSNPDGSAELCGSNGNWEHAEQDSKGDWHRADPNSSGSRNDYGEYGYFGDDN